MPLSNMHTSLKKNDYSDDLVYHFVQPSYESGTFLSTTLLLLLLIIIIWDEGRIYWR